MNITNTSVTSHSGSIYGGLPYLTSEQNKAMNEIGYSGKLNGEPMSWTKYLNSLGIGTFEITQTKWDNGDFSEKFMITRATL